MQKQPLVKRFAVHAAIGLMLIGSFLFLGLIFIAQRITADYQRPLAIGDWAVVEKGTSATSPWKMELAVDGTPQFVPAAKSCEVSHRVQILGFLDGEAIVQMSLLQHQHSRVADCAAGWIATVPRQALKRWGPSI